MKGKMKRIGIPLAAAAFSAGLSMVSFGATGWVQEDGEWCYYNSDGSKATDEFKKSGDNWFYLDSDGIMLRSSIVEKDDNYYYVNSAGAMVSNEWREVENEDGGSDEPDTWWYYLQSNGKAVKASDSGDSVKTVNLSTSTGSARFIFDEEGHMLTGWIDEDGEMLTDEEAWKEGLYYCDPENGGRMVLNGWKYLEAEDDKNDDRDGDGYWFYFQSNGKKVKDTDQKTINGRKYRFNEYGAAIFEWFADPALSSSSTGLYYNSEEECWLSTGWFKAYPDEDIDPEGYEEDELYWYYADSKGELAASEIKTIKGQKYAFDAYGKMLHGLYKITFEEDNKTIAEAVEIESEDDLPDENEDVFVYYFGDSPKEGVMKTGTCTLEIDGEKYYYKFRTSSSKKGAGVNGIDDGVIYIQGRRMEAEEGTKYEPFEYDGKEYLINTSGKIMKKKTNIRDADDVYYCTDKDGVIIYSGDEKYTS